MIGSAMGKRPTKRFVVKLSYMASVARESRRTPATLARKTASESGAYDSRYRFSVSLPPYRDLLRQFRSAGATSVRTTQAVPQEQMTNSQAKPKVLVAD